jgi:hypothetical protein
MAQVIHELSGFGRIKPTLDQCRDDVIVGTAVGHQPHGQLNI